LKKYIVPYVDILVYSLMPTHYHVLGRVKQQPSQTSQTSEVFKTSEVSVSRQVSLAMQKFGISYTKAINKRFSRVGALFQGQFQGKPIQTYAHLLNLCVYIHANPVKDRLVSLPEEWEYSNYLEWMGLRDGTLVKREFILEHFGSPEDYKQLILNYIKTRYLSDDFRKYVQEFEERKFCAIGDGIVKNRQK
jgi:putative transposase